MSCRSVLKREAELITRPPSISGVSPDAVALATPGEAGARPALRLLLLAPLRLGGWRGGRGGPAAATPRQRAYRRPRAPALPSAPAGHRPPASRSPAASSPGGPASAGSPR